MKLQCGVGIVMMRRKTKKQREQRVAISGENRSRDVGSKEWKRKVEGTTPKNVLETSEEVIFHYHTREEKGRYSNQCDRRLLRQRR